MSRRIKVERVERRSNSGKFYYIDPITGMPSEEFATLSERDAEIGMHYIEANKCEHEWEVLTRKRNYYEPGMVSGTQRCTRCDKRAYYTSEE